MNMKYFYEYEDSMRQCETLLKQNFAKLRKYSKCQESSLFQPTKKNDLYMIMKKKLVAVQENIAYLKSEYNGLTRVNFNLSLLENNFTEKYFKYLVRQEALRLKFIEMIDECKRVNSSLDDILKDYSVEALDENFNRSPSNCFGATSSDHLNAFSEFDLSVPKLDWDEFEMTSFLNELAEDQVFAEQPESTVLYTSSMGFASKSIDSSSADLKDNPPVKKYYSTKILGAKPVNDLASSGRNEASNTAQSIVCGICGRNFKTKYHLNRHMLLHIGLKPFECAECGKSFTQKATMEEHARLLHNPYHTRQHKCDTCDRRYTSQSRLHVHKRLARHLSAFELYPFSSSNAYGGVIMKECHSAIFSGTRNVNKSISLSRTRNKPLNSSQSAVCNICGRNFSRQCDLRKHMFLHSGLKPFKCPECGRSFARRSYLKKHVLLMHIPHRLTLDSFYYCAHCKYRCKVIENLAYHIKREHIPNLNLEDFGCTQCGKTFERKGSRRRHEKNFHVKGNFYCCMNCGMRFKYSRSLARHLQRKRCQFEYLARVSR